MKALFLCLITFLPAIFHAQTKTVRFDIITTDDGLPENSVLTMQQDKLGLLWLGTQKGLVKYDGDHMEVYQYEPTVSLGMQYWWHIIQIEEDPAGDLLLLDTGNRLFRFDRETEQIRLLYQFEAGFSYLGNDFKLAPDSTMWFSNGGIHRLQWQEDMDSIQADQVITIDTGIVHTNSYRYMGISPTGDLWIASSRGLYHWQGEEEGLELFQSQQDTGFNVLNNYNDLTFSSDGSIWMSSGGAGLVNFKPSSQTFKHYLHQPNNPNSPLHNGFLRLHLDKSGKIWMAFVRGGLQPILQWFNTKTEEFSTIKVVYTDLHEAPGTAYQYHCFYETRSGSILTGTWRGGMLKYNPERSAFRWLEHEPDNKNSLSDNVVNGMMEDHQGNLWVCTNSGLNRYDRESGDFTRFQNIKNDPTSLSFDDVGDILEDRNLQIWVGTSNGLNKFLPGQNQFLRFLDGVYITAIQQSDRTGMLWISTMGQGLIRFDPRTELFKSYMRTGDPTTGPWANRIRDVIEDDEGLFWLTGYGDGPPQRFDPETETFESFDIVKGVDMIVEGNGNFWTNYNGLSYISLEDSLIQEYSFLKPYFPRSIEKDNRGRIWGAGENGLFCFDPTSATHENFYVSDGLLTNRVESWYSAQSSQGELFFSTAQGLLWFHPDSILTDQFSPKLVFNKVEVNGIELPIAPNSPLKQHISLVDQLQLKHVQNNLTFHYAALHFKNPAANQYQVMLEGKDPDWRDMGNFRQVDYTNLKPGRYTFRVRASNNRGIWTSPEEDLALQVRILPPWWLTWWGTTLFILAGLILLYYIYRYLLNRQLAITELKQIKKLDEFKSKLYTNITHEFRTPLTVIQGINNKTKLRAEVLRAKEIVANTEVVQRNSAQLLKLINQMLELQKLESGSLAINKTQGDIIAYLTYIFEPFRAHAATKGIPIHVLTKEKELLMDFDPEKVLSIVSNLLSNAIKFTPSGGDIYITLRKEINSEAYFTLEIKDTGIGIPANKLGKVFDRFYQVYNTSTRKAEGTGIGLALTKELVHLLEGNISVDSTLQEGTTFWVQLPITNVAPLQQPESLSDLNGSLAGFLNQNGTAPSKVLTPKSSDQERAVVLLVEDNADMLAYLQAALQDQYQLQSATNGAEGIKLAIEHTPDLIVSDVMMPEKDGFELTHTLKTDPRTSHIPIVLLTAKADVASKISGLETGADAYLPKPFNPKELEVRLRKLIELRQTLQEKYNTGDFISRLKKRSEKTLSLDEMFLKKAHQVIEDNYENEDFGIAQLMTALNVSRTQLHRKLKALIDQSASEFIRKIRVEKAAELLLQSDLNISEISYKTGFKSPTYFTQVFTNTIGKSPTSFRKSAFEERNIE